MQGAQSGILKVHYKMPLFMLEGTTSYAFTMKSWKLTHQYSQGIENT